MKDGPFEDVFPIKTLWIFHCYVSLPEGRYIIPGWKYRSTSPELTDDFSRFLSQLNSR